jgi:hypothetical protein
MDINEIKTFLARVIPWQDISINGPYLNIHWTYEGQHKDRTFWGGTACYNMLGATSVVQNASLRQGTKDIYYCVSSQKTCEMKQTANGQNRRQAVRSQHNASKIKVIPLDVDVAKGHANLNGKNYKDSTEAAKALVKFCTDSGIPRPSLLVGSGSGGLHVYWVLDNEIEIAEWQPLANAMAEATRRFGFHCDTAVTVDAARVMRMPQTMHSKHGQPAKLYTQAMLPHDYPVDEMRRALAPYMGAKVIPLTPKGKAGLADELSAGIESNNKPRNLQTIADANCGFIKEALETGGATYANPLWNLTTLVATFTDGGREDAHAMANGHPDYSAGSTDELYDRKLREREEKSIGWPSCTSVENAGCTACGTCTLRQPTSSPLTFGTPHPAVLGQQTSSPLEWPLPDTYDMDKDGVVRRTLYDKTEKKEVRRKVCEYSWKNVWLQKEGWKLHFTVQGADDPTPRRLGFELATAMQPAKFAGVSGELGFALEEKERKPTADFIVNWIRKLQTIKGAAVNAIPYGWHVENGEIVGFSYGGRLWMKDNKHRYAASPSPALDQQYTPTGKIDRWMAMSNLICKKFNSPAHNAILASAFAAPLIRFTGQEGMLLACYSIDSGRGKSTAMKTASAVWGHSKLGLQGGPDTQNSTFGKMTELQALPIYWDEIKGKDQEEEFVQLLFNLSRGKDKSRMNADTSLRKVGTWKTLMISATNSTILDHISKSAESTDAGIMRVFEIGVPNPVDAGRGSVIDTMAATLEDNYGWAGLHYARWLGAHTEKAARDTLRFRDFYEKRLKAQKEERMWFSTMATIYLGAKYANRLGLTQIDLRALDQYLVDMLKQMREYATAKPNLTQNSTGALALLGKFLEDCRARHTLLTDNMALGAGQPRTGLVNTIGSTDKIDYVIVHKAVKQRILRFDTQRFDDWLKQKGNQPSTVKKLLDSKYGAVRRNGRLGGGTPLAGTTAHLIELDLNHPELSKFFDG